MITPAPAARAFARGSRRELRRVAALLRTETVGGFVLVGAALIALVWANSPWAPSYSALRDFAFGPEALHIHLTVGEWAADGLLAVFFFLIGLELKHEFVAGDLRSPATAIVPVAAAAGGVLVPVLIYLALNAGGHGLRGWAVPAATDIAFALAVLAIISSHLPAALRTFLLTLAVVDDLIAIVIIAVAYTASINVGRAAPRAAADRRVRLPRTALADVLLRPVAGAWSSSCCRSRRSPGRWSTRRASTRRSPGVAMGMCVPVLRKRDEDSNQPPLADTLDHVIRPISAGFVVPAFALFSAGVTSAACRVSVPRCATPSRWGSSPDWSSASPSASSRRRSSSRASAGSRSTSPSAGRTSSASACWPASASRCRCSSPS
jgi:NhaA family Na+:H+ antiporter